MVCYSELDKQAHTWVLKPLQVLHPWPEPRFALFCFLYLSLLSLWKELWHGQNKGNKVMREQYTVQLLMCLLLSSVLIRKDCDYKILLMFNVMTKCCKVKRINETGDEVQTSVIQWNNEKIFPLLPFFHLCHISILLETYFCMYLPRSKRVLKIKNTYSIKSFFSLPLSASKSSTTETMKRLPFLGQLLGRLCWNPYVTVCGEWSFWTTWTQSLVGFTSPKQTKVIMMVIILAWCIMRYVVVYFFADTSRGLLLGCLWGLYSERPSNAVEKKANQWIRVRT